MFLCNAPNEIVGTQYYSIHEIFSVNGGRSKLPLITMNGVLTLDFNLAVHG